MTSETPYERALALMAGLVLEDGRRWGDAAEPWQWDDAREVLDPTSETPYNFLTRPRGGDKSTGLGGMATAALLAPLLPPGSRSYGVAADRDQAQIIVDAIAGYLARTPGLAGALRVLEGRVLNPKTGASFEVLPADGPSAYGLKPALLVVDELGQWKSTRGARQVWEAVVSAVMKVPGCKLVVLTSAGEPSHWSHKVLEHAKRQKLWRVNEVPGPLPWVPIDKLAEQAALLTVSQFARLHLNQWTESEDRLTTNEDVRAAVTLDGAQPYQQGRAYVIGLDIGVKKDRTVASICHVEPTLLHHDGSVPVFRGDRVVLDRQEVWSGSRRSPVSLVAVEEWVAGASRMYGRAQVVLDPWQGLLLAEKLRARGVRVTEFAFTPASIDRLARALYQLLRDHRLALPDDDDLIDELSNVRLRESAGGILRMDHDSGQHDDRAISLSLAAVHLLDGSVGTTGVGQRTGVGRYGEPGQILWEDQGESKVTAFYRARVPGFAAAMDATKDSGPLTGRR